MDEIAMCQVNITLALPLVLVALVMVVSIGKTFPDFLGGQSGLIGLVLASWIWVRFAGIVRVEELQIEAMGYVALEKVAGAFSLR